MWLHNCRDIGCRIQCCFARSGRKIIPPQNLPTLIENFLDTIRMILFWRSNNPGSMAKARSGE